MTNIELMIKDEDDLYEKYNNKVSKDLIEYLVYRAKFIKDDIKIVLKSSINVDNLETIVKEGLQNYYFISKRIDKVNNKKQVIFFIIGVVFLILSTFIDLNILKEIIIIAGWVAIWEVVDISLNLDSDIRINRKIIKKLINSEIEVSRE